MENIFFGGCVCHTQVLMSELSGHNLQIKYRWPWFVLAAVLAGFALVVLWVGMAAEKLDRQHDLNAPLPASAPIR